MITYKLNNSIYINTEYKSLLVLTCTFAYAGRVRKCKQHPISEHSNGQCDQPHHNRSKLL